MLASAIVEARYARACEEHDARTREYVRDDVWCLCCVSDRIRACEKLLRGSMPPHTRALLFCARFAAATAGAACAQCAAPRLVCRDERALAGELREKWAWEENKAGNKPPNDTWPPVQPTADEVPGLRRALAACGDARVRACHDVGFRLATGLLAITDAQPEGARLMRSPQWHCPWRRRYRRPAARSRNKILRHARGMCRRGVCCTPSRTVSRRLLVSCRAVRESMTRTRVLCACSLS